MSHLTMSNVEAMVSNMVGEEVKKWTAHLQDTYTERYNDMLQERKETLAIVNRLGKYVENVDGKVNALRDQLRSSRTKTGAENSDILLESSTFIEQVDPKLTQRVEMLEIICGYDMTAESSAAISKGCSDFILPSRKINQRIATLEKAISQLNCDLNVLLKEGVISFSRNNPQQDDTPDMSDPYMRLLGPQDLHSLLGITSNQYDAYGSDGERQRTSKRIKSANGRRRQSPAKESSRQYYNTPHPPGYRTMPTKTRFIPHRPVSAPSTKTQEQVRPAWQQQSPRDYTASPSVIRHLYDMVHAHEEKLNALSTEVKGIPKIDEDKIILRIERRNSERDAAIEDKLKAHQDHGKALSARIADMTKIIHLDEDKKAALEDKIKELENRLLRAGSTDEQMREVQLIEFAREKDALDRHARETVTEVRELQGELKKINAEKSALERRIENEQRERERSERTMNEAVEEVRGLSADLKKVNNEKSALQVKMDSERRERERLERLKNEEVDTLEYDKRMLMEQLQTVQTHMETEKMKAAELQKELERHKRDLRDKLADAETKRNHEKQTLDEQLYSLKREKDHLVDENADLKRKLNKEIEEFGRRSDSVKIERERLKHDLEGDLEATKRRNAQLETEKQRAEADKERVEVEKNRVAKEVEQLKQDMEFLKNQLASAEMKLARGQTDSAAGAASIPGSAIQRDKNSPDTTDLGPLVFSPEQLRVLSKELAQSFSAEDGSPGPLVNAAKKKADGDDYQHQFPTPYPHTKEEREKRSQRQVLDERQAGAESSISDSTYQDRHQRRASKMSTSDSGDAPEKRRYSRSALKEKTQQDAQAQHSRRLLKQRSLSEEVSVMEDIIREKEELLAHAAEHKATIKAGIKEWIASFTAEHGHPPTVQDKESVSDLYIAHQEAALQKEDAEGQLQDARDLLSEKIASLASVNAKLGTEA